MGGSPGYPMFSSEFFRNFLRRSAKDFVRELEEEVLVVEGEDFSVAQNRFTSIHASHPIETDSIWSEGESFCLVSL